MADGLSNAEIARRLWITPSTVRKHLENIFYKVGGSEPDGGPRRLVQSDPQLVGGHQPGPLVAIRVSAGSTTRTRDQRLSRTSRRETLGR